MYMSTMDRDLHHACIAIRGIEAQGKTGARRLLWVLWAHHAIRYKVEGCHVMPAFACPYAV